MTGTLTKAVRNALRVPTGRVAGRPRETARGWRSLVVYDAKGHALAGVERIVALAQWRDTGACAGWFDYEGGEHEDLDDKRTWGPRCAHDIDWRGFPPLCYDRFAHLP